MTRWRMKKNDEISVAAKLIAANDQVPGAPVEFGPVKITKKLIAGVVSDTAVERISAFQTAGRRSRVKAETASADGGN